MIVIRFVFLQDFSACRMTNWRETRLEKTDLRAERYHHAGEKKVCLGQVIKVGEETVRTDIFRVTEEMWWLMAQQIK